MIKYVHGSEFRELRIVQNHVLLSIIFTICVLIFLITCILRLGFENH